MRIVVAGTGRLGVAVMAPLIEAGHEIVALLLNGRGTRGWRRALYVVESRLMPKAESPVALAVSRGIPMLWLDRMDEAELARIAALNPELIITCGFSVILKKPLLALPSIGCINVHSSLLPAHRGPTPFTQTVLLGEETAGMTVHLTDEGIDTGDMLAQDSFEVEPQDTGLTVYRKGAAVAREMIVEVVERIEREGLRGWPQPPGGSYERKLETKDLRIVWSKRAVEIDRLLRAVHPFQYAWFAHRGRAVRVMEGWNEGVEVREEPGVVVANRPYVKVATGEGLFVVKSGFVGGWGLGFGRGFFRGRRWGRGWGELSADGADWRRWVWMGVTADSRIGQALRLSMLTTMTMTSTMTREP